MKTLVAYKVNEKCRKDLALQGKDAPQELVVEFPGPVPTWALEAGHLRESAVVVNLTGHSRRIGDSREEVPALWHYTFVQQEGCMAYGMKYSLFVPRADPVKYYGPLYAGLSDFAGFLDYVAPTRRS